MGIALAISIPVAVLLLILLILGFSYDYVGQKQKHERQVLALEKGLPVPPEPVTVGPRSKVLLWIAVVVPPIGALIALGVTIWAFSNPSIPVPLKWDITGIAFIAAGWTTCIIVSTTAIIAAVRSFIIAARQNPQPVPVPMPMPRIPSVPPESHHP